MFKRKLKALDFSNIENFNPQDEEQFRSLIIWLEDQKIRHYTVEDRQSLRNKGAGNWVEIFQKYLTDIICPLEYNNENRIDVIAWLLSYAVNLEYGDKVSHYQTITADSTATTSQSQTSTNPFDNLDFDDPELVKGVMALAQFLNIPPPPNNDHKESLKACCILIINKVSEETSNSFSSNPQMNIDNVPTGMDTGDMLLDQNIKILRLLHIAKLRVLQTEADKAMVAVQDIVADPKTDSKLGKVGR